MEKKTTEIKLRKRREERMGVGEGGREERMMSRE